MSTLEFPHVRRSLAARTRHHTKRAVRKGAPEVKTLFKFGLVGGSGYIVNLAVFGPAEALGLHYMLAATAAFLVAVGNNFHWNRRWTFNAVGDAAVHRQALRFLVVSLVSFLLGLLILWLLVGMKWNHLVAQAVALVVVTPVGFVGNRLWTFAEPGTLRRYARRGLELRSERR
jgi:putative flippase GtrA